MLKKSRSTPTRMRLALGLLLGLAPVLASGIQLSEIELVSALGEPLDLRLSATDPLGSGAGGIRVRLGSAEDYQKAGLPRPALLSNARFDVQQDGERLRVRIHSAGRTQEPLVNLLLRVSDGSTSVLREYSVMFDPPRSPSKTDAVLAVTTPAASLQLPRHADLPALSPSKPVRPLMAENTRPIAPRTLTASPPPTTVSLAKLRSPPLVALKLAAKTADLSLKSAVLAPLPSLTADPAPSTSGSSGAPVVRAIAPNLRLAPVIALTEYQSAPRPTVAIVTQTSVAASRGAPLPQPMTIASNSLSESGGLPGAALPASFAMSPPTLSRREAANLLASDRGERTSAEIAPAASAPGAQNHRAEPTFIVPSPLPGDLTPRSLQRSSLLPRANGLRLMERLRLKTPRYDARLDTGLRLTESLSPESLATTPLNDDSPVLRWLGIGLMVLLGLLALMLVLTLVRKAARAPKAPGRAPKHARFAADEPAQSAPSPSTEGVVKASRRAKSKASTGTPAAKATPGERISRARKAAAAVALPTLQASAAGTAPALATAPDFHAEVARLLRNALRRSPQRLDLRYKLLEVSHAAGDTDAFVENARQYASQCRGTADPNWPAVAKMGLALAPDEPLFVSPPGEHQPHTARHYDVLMARGLAGLLSGLKEDYTRLAHHPVFLNALNDVNRREGGRPTALVAASQISEMAGGAQIWLKREDLRAKRESQRINAYGQVLLARQLGKKRIVAATRSGAHGEAVAMAGRALGMPVLVFMPALLMTNSAHPTIKRMKSLGAELRGIPPEPDSDPRTAALAEWLASSPLTFYATGLDAGPPPYPAIVSDLQSVIGLEARRQMLPKAPDGVMAAVCARAAGPAALGFLQPFLDAEETALYCVEADQPAECDEHHHRYWREHAWLRASGRVQYVPVLPKDAAAAGKLGAEQDALPNDALNAASLAHALALAKTGTSKQAIVVLLTNPLEVNLAS